MVLGGKRFMMSFKPEAGTALGSSSDMERPPAGATVVVVVVVASVVVVAAVVVVASVVVVAAIVVVGVVVVVVEAVVVVGAVVVVVDVVVVPAVVGSLGATKSNETKRTVIRLNVDLLVPEVVMVGVVGFVVGETVVGFVVGETVVGPVGVVGLGVGVVVGGQHGLDGKKGHQKFDCCPEVPC